jgi:hypothetical protein
MAKRHASRCRREKIRCRERVRRCPSDNHAGLGTGEQGPPPQRSRGWLPDRPPDVSWNRLRAHRLINNASALISTKNGPADERDTFRDKVVLMTHEPSVARRRIAGQCLVCRFRKVVRYRRKVRSHATNVTTIPQPPIASSSVPKRVSSPLRANSSTPDKVKTPEITNIIATVRHSFPFFAPGSDDKLRI